MTLKFSMVCISHMALKKITLKAALMDCGFFNLEKV